MGNPPRGAVLGERVGVADGFWTRLRGLLGRPPLEEGEGLLLVSTQGVHMYGMRYPLDVLFLDRERRVVAAYRGLEPGARSRFHREARYALELPAGTIDRTGTEPGDPLEWAERDGRWRANGR